MMRLFLGRYLEVEVTTTPYSIKGSRAEVFSCPGFAGLLRLRILELRDCWALGFRAMEP